MTKRNLYLSNTLIDEAKEKYMEALCGLLEVSYEKIPSKDALGRVTKDAVYAKYSSPLYNCSAMDGIAVVSEKTVGAREGAPVFLKADEDYLIVDTGDPVRFPYDAVIMAEDIVETETGVNIFAAAAPWQHVRPVGEDIVAGEMILPSRHLIRAIDIGVLISAGITGIEVIRRPKVAVIPTGTELISDPSDPKEGDIIDSNSFMFSAMVEQNGGVPSRHEPIIDDYDLIKAGIKEAVENNDIVIVNAGSSAGTEDYTVHILRELGEVIVHGVAVKPGKPVILAVVNGKPVIGLPGYPVAAYIAFENFVKPVMQKLLGEEIKKDEYVNAVSSTRMVSSLKHREYVRVKLGNVGGRLIAAPLSRGAGAAMSLVRADGFGIIEQNQEGIEAGCGFPVKLTRSMDEINNTLVVIGSHDLMLDVAADIMQQKAGDAFMSSTHVGSMGGLMALRRGDAHIAPTHLLDEETGIYNEKYIRDLFDEPMALIKGVHRIQGIMVKKGNPLNIKGVEDLTKCRYVNRQRGAGTRILLDYKIRTLGISPDDINGYDREAATHMAVAALVAGDSADAGMGVASAAKAMDLDFIEVGPEEYDFALRKADLDNRLVKIFLDVITSDEFKARLDELGGYSCADTGRIIYV